MSLIIKKCIECPFANNDLSTLEKVWCEIEKHYVQLDMSDCKNFQPEDLSQYSHWGLHKEDINIDDLLHAIQQSYCIGTYCENYNKDKHCGFYDCGFCYKKGDKKLND